MTRTERGAGNAECGDPDSAFRIPHSAFRHGMTLYEVILALAIFSGALTALSTSLTTGSRAAVQSRLRTRAILLCESKLSEVLAGLEPMQTVGETPFDDSASSWTWNLQVEAAVHDDLLLLELTVSHAGSADVSYTITRYVRDPQLFLDAAEAAEESAESEE